MKAPSRQAITWLMPAMNSGAPLDIDNREAIQNKSRVAI